MASKYAVPDEPPLKDQNLTEAMAASSDPHPPDKDLSKLDCSGQAQQLGPIQPYYPQQNLYPPPAYNTGCYPQAANIDQASYGGSQQRLVFVNSSHPNVILQTLPPPTQSFVGHILVGVVAFLFCWPLGLVAVVLAIIAQSRAAADPKSARHYGRASIAVSISAIVLGAIIAVVVGIVVGTTTSYTYTSACKYYKNEECYKHKDSYDSWNSCKAERGRHIYYDGYYCYYN